MSMVCLFAVVVVVLVAPAVVYLYVSIQSFKLMLRGNIWELSSKNNDLAISLDAIGHSASCWR